MNTNKRIARHINTHTDYEMQNLRTRVTCLLVGGAVLIALLFCATC